MKFTKTHLAFAVVAAAMIALNIFARPVIEAAPAPAVADSAR